MDNLSSAVKDFIQKEREITDFGVRIEIRDYQRKSFM